MTVQIPKPPALKSNRRELQQQSSTNVSIRENGNGCRLFSSTTPSSLINNHVPSDVTSSSSRSDTTDEQDDDKTGTTTSTVLTSINSDDVNKYKSLPILPKICNEVIPQPLDDGQKIKKSFWQRVKDRYSIRGQQHRIHRGEEFFQAATRQGANPIWYGPGCIGREFRPRHALLTMHIWFIHKRLISDEYDKDMALMIQEELFDILWNDTTSRIRAVPGVMEMSVNKYLLQVQQYTFLHLTHYDHIYTEYYDKPDQRLKELRKLVWHHIFVRNPIYEKQYNLLDRYVWYIDCNYQNNMFHWPDEYYRDGRISWTSIPDFSNLLDENGKLLKVSHPIHPDDIIPTPWLKNITLAGTDYYWNPETRETSWEKPTTCDTK